MSFIASNIRYIGELNKHSQEFFAEELSWTRSTIASFELGRTEPSVSKLITLSAYTKIPIDTLIKIDLRKSKDLAFIEIQQGEYFGEDDIVRLEDDYGRVST